MTRKADWLRTLAGKQKTDRAPPARSEEPADKKATTAASGTEPAQVFDPFKEQNGLSR